MIVAIVIGLNALFFKGGIFTLYLAFVFLDTYSLIWGGDLWTVSLPEETIDLVFTSAARYIGFILVILAILQGRFVQKLNLVDAVITLFFFLMLLSPVTAGFSPEQPILMVPRAIQYYTLYILTRIIVRSEHDIHRFFQFTLISFVPVFICISLQYLSGYFGEGYDQGHPGVLVQFIPFLLALSILAKGRRILFLITISVTMFLATFHGSRRVLIEMVGYLALHFRLSILSLFLISIVVVTGPYLYDRIPETTRLRLDSTASNLIKIKNGDTSDEMLDSLSTGRWSLLRAGLSMWSEAPVFGIGLSNNVEYMESFGGKIRRARIHNYYAEVLVDLGIVGFLILISLVVVGFRLLKKVENVEFARSAFLRVMIKAYKHQFVLLHVVALFGNSMFGAKYVWVTYALIGSLSSLTLTQKKAKSKTLVKSRT